MSKKSEKETAITAIPEFDTVKFLSEVESAERMIEKVSIINRVLNKESSHVKNMRAELKKKFPNKNFGDSVNYDYIPIEVVEESLRQVFFRQVDFVVKQSYRDLNSFIVVASINYKDPITHELRTIDGIGAKALQQDSGASISSFNTTMKPNALELGVGIAYSRAIKNASKKLGKLFGASLNRDEELDNVSVFKGAIVKSVEDIKKEIEEIISDPKTEISEDDRLNAERTLKEGGERVLRVLLNFLNQKYGKRA